MEQNSHKQSSFAWKLISDVTSGLISSFCAQPFVTIVDRSVIRNANGSLNIYKGIFEGYKQLFTNIKSFYGQKEVYYVWFVYFSTYTMSNTSQTISKHFDISPDFPQLISTFLANFGSTILQDNYIARTYGKVKSTRFSNQSLFYFVIRDITAIGCAFTTPKYISAFLHKYFDYFTQNTMRSLTQLILVPFTIIFLATPFQLLGLDHFNNPIGSANQRIQFLKLNYLKTCSVAYLRFLPLYGFGGVLNLQLVKNLNALALF